MEIEKKEWTKSTEGRVADDCLSRDKFQFNQIKPIICWQIKGNVVFALWRGGDRVKEQRKVKARLSEE